MYERQLYTRDAALASLAGNDVFGPVARVPRDSAQVVEEGNVLWADIDEADGLDERLATRVSVAPSVLLDSGNRGFWAFWKLNRPIPAAELESLNRGLAHQLGGDVGSVRRTQLARLPGSRRKETGRVAKVVAFAPVSYDPQQLAAVRETRISRQPVVINPRDGAGEVLVFNEGQTQERRRPEEHRRVDTFDIHVFQALNGVHHARRRLRAAVARLR